MIRGAGASMLTKACFNGLFSLTNISFSTIRSFTFEPINKIGLFVSGWLVFHMDKSTAELVDWLEGSRNTIEFVSLFNSFRDTSRIWDGHQSPAFIWFRVLVDCSRAIKVFAGCLSLLKSPVEITQFPKAPLI